MIKLFATDLDRTLLPVGSQPYDGSMSILNKILKENKMIVVFVSGRHLSLIKDAIKTYNTPSPDYIIGDVGTTLWVRVSEEFVRDMSWDSYIKKNTKNWNVKLFKEKIKERNGLRLQEKSKQNIFKLSYYIDDIKNSEKIIKDFKNIISNLCGCEDATVVYSIDETLNQGLLDVLPKAATKQGAIEFLREKLDIKKNEIIYCGDSGNDILPLTQGYFSIMVRNTIPEVRNEVFNIAKEKGILNKIYIAEGYGGLNGYYVSGIIEGMIKFKFISEKYLNCNTRNKI